MAPLSPPRNNEKLIRARLRARPGLRSLEFFRSRVLVAALSPPRNNEKVIRGDSVPAPVWRRARPFSDEELPKCHETAPDKL
jgi:hypothetical protein